MLINGAVSLQLSWETKLSRAVLDVLELKLFIVRLIGSQFSR